MRMQMSVVKKLEQPFRIFKEALLHKSPAATLSKCSDYFTAQYKYIHHRIDKVYKIYSYTVK